MPVLTRATQCHIPENGIFREYNFYIIFKLTFVTIIFLSGSVGEFSRYRCNDGINRPNKPPSLPPRRVARPRSPWHDVPKNNSPVYGNFQVLAATAVEKKDVISKETTDPNIEEESVPQFDEWDQDFQDEILGTPRGFVYVQNKWKAVEKSGEWCQDQQGNKEKPLLEKSLHKETFSTNSNNAENKIMHVGMSSSDSVMSDTVRHEDKAGTVFIADTCSSDIYSVAHKDRLPAKNVSLSFDEQSEKVEEKANYLCDIADEKVYKELNCINDKAGKVEMNNVNIKFNDNVKHNIRSTTEHDDTFGDRILNYSSGSHNNSNINATNNKHLSDDIPLTLRESETDSPSNKHEVLPRDTMNCQVMAGVENDSLSSSQLCSERDVKEVKEESIDKAYNIKNSSISSEFCDMPTNSSSQQKINTLFNNVYNKNIQTSRMAKDLSHRVADHAETVNHKEISPHLNRHSDELNILLAQLAEITSAPLLPQGTASSLVDIPDDKKPKTKDDESFQLGPTQPELV
jgi:hypothetical protein